MSDIRGNLSQTNPDESQKVVQPFPYIINTDYDNRLMAITLPGDWSGSVNQDGIVVSTDTVSEPGYSIVSFIFTNASAGAKASALLTDVDNDITYSLSLTYIG